jgi:SAM-dependent methyltransferase
VDLVAVGQALHWFDFEAFYREVRRVLAPGGILAAWTYDLLRIDPAVDELVSHIERRVVGDYWPERSRHVDERYASIPFPFERLELPQIEMAAHWSLDTLLGYIRSWSAMGRYRAAHGEDPLLALEPRLRRAWGEAATRRAHWPLTILAARVT